VIRAVDHVPAAPQKFEDVSAAVRAAIVADRLGKAARAQADAVLAEVRGGKSLADLATGKSLELKKADAVGRDGVNVDPAVVRKAFELPHPAQGKATFDLAPLTADRYAVIALTAVTDGDPDKTDAETRTMMLEQISQGLGGVEASAFVQALRKSTQIEVIEERM
jgi:peptidyl-prolyl cis-trans isomerase D